MSAQPTLDSAVLAEAADWLMRFQDGDIDTAARGDFERWRNRSAMHAAAWQRAEAVLSTFGGVPAALRKTALPRLGRPIDRRRALQALAVLLAAPTASWLAMRQLPWAQWAADYRTTTGERRTLDLADGTRVVMNTASAIDVRFTPNERRLILQAGEVLITAAQTAASQPPLRIATTYGDVVPQRARFSVRQFERDVEVAVFAGAADVRIQMAAARRIHRGESIRLGNSGFSASHTVDDSAALWEHGMLVAKDWRLQTLLAELGRYRRGVLRCHPAVADLPVAGAFPIDDIDACLRLLERTLPVRISQNTRYWVTLEPA